MTPRELIRAASQRLRLAGIPDPENDSSLLLSSLCGIAPLTLRLDEETRLDEDMLFRYESLVERRLTREPLQYILREAPFCGHLFYVDSRVLIPRPETELLCGWALEVLSGQKEPRILDLCCGSGCIGLSLKSARPDAAVTLSDLSADALFVAGINAQRLSLDVSYHEGDLLDGISSASFDLIVCNPPYIPAGDCEDLQPEVLYEPRMALDGGPDGLAFYRRLVASAYSVLPSGAALLMELGINESFAVSSLLADSGYCSLKTRCDLAGIERMILAFRP